MNGSRSTRVVYGIVYIYSTRVFYHWCLQKKLKTEYLPFEQNYKYAALLDDFGTGVDQCL